ncbi:AroM family protein [Flindersiella endophytica]
MRRRLGVLTIGQSPRVDLTPELARWLPPVELVERGALDELTRDEIAKLAPGDEVGHVLTTRLTDGSSVVLDHDLVVPRVQAAVDWLELAGVDATVVVCTGEFPPLRHDRPLLFAERLLVSGVTGLCDPGDVLGVVCPLPEQEAMSVAKWGSVAATTEVAAATPYDGVALDSVPAAAAELAERGARWIVLDCMGYTGAMRQAAQEAAGIPVLLARSVVARLACEVVA